MTTFPQSAAYGKKIPFATLRRQGIAPRYGDFIKSLVWAYKLSPETMQLAATDSVREIEVMDLAVKDQCSALRSLAAVISALDKIIPSPLIFRVFDEEGRVLKIAFNLKTSGGVAHGDSEVFRLFHTDATDFHKLGILAPCIRLGNQKHHIAILLCPCVDSNVPIAQWHGAVLISSKTIPYHFFLRCRLCQSIGCGNKGDAHEYP